MLARLSIGVLSLLSRCAVRRAIAPTAPGCGTLGWLLDVECGAKGLLECERNEMHPDPPSRSTPKRAPTFDAGAYCPPRSHSGAKWMGGYRFPGDHAGFGRNRARPEDADMISAYSESLQKLRTLWSGPRTSAVGTANGQIRLTRSSASSLVRPQEAAGAESGESRGGDSARLRDGFRPIPRKGTAGYSTPNHGFRPLGVLDKSRRSGKKAPRG
jgi:hypothetical protein